jgi:hypothetical protein
MIQRNWENRRLRFSLTSKNDLKEQWEVTSEIDSTKFGEKALRFSATSKNDLKVQWEVTSENDLMDKGELVFVINLDV